MKYESEDLAINMEAAPDFMEMDTKKRVETISQALGGNASSLISN